MPQLESLGLTAWHLRACNGPLLAAVLALVPASIATATEIHSLVVTAHQGRYDMSAETSIAATPEYIHQVLVDFDNFHRLADGIAETKFIREADSDEQLGYTLIKSCVWFFCKSFERLERFQSEPPDKLVTVAIPERSDFEDYRTEWRLAAEAEGTRLSVSASMKPKFWIPPLIGNWAIRRKLELTAEQLGVNIEYLYAEGLTLAALPDE